MSTFQLLSIKRRGRRRKSKIIQWSSINRNQSYACQSKILCVENPIGFIPFFLLSHSYHPHPSIWQFDLVWFTPWPSSAWIELIFVNVTMKISFPHRKYMANLNPAVYCAEICPLIMCKELAGTLVWPKKIELESSISDGNAPFCTYKLLSIKITRAHLNTQSMSF